MSKLVKRKIGLHSLTEGPILEVKDILVNGKPYEEYEDPFDIDPDFLFFSDLHLHDRKEFSRVDPGTGLNSRLTEGLNILDQILEICEQTPIQTAYFLGDIFERKDNIPNHVLIEFQKRLEMFTKIGVPLRCLLGNHDFNLPNYPILSIFKSKSYFDFIDKPVHIPCTGMTIYFIPFQQDWEDFKRIWKDAHRENPNIICMHQELPDGTYESGKSIAGVWDLKINPNIIYLSGHLHRPQKVHGIQYLGSPYPTKFLPNDDGNYYIWFYNSKTKQIKPHRLNYSKFVNLKWYEFEGPIDNQQLKEIVNGNYVRIVGEVLKEDIEPKSKKFVKETLEKLGAKAVIFNIKIKQQTPIEISETSVEDDKTIITNYAKKNAGGLDSNKLIKMGVEIYESP